MDANFDQIDFGPLKPYLEDDDVTDISYDNEGQIHLKTLSKGIFRIDNPNINNAFIEKLAFQCSNVMGKTFNMAHPFLDAESAELRLAFIHDSIARNGVACVVRKTPAKIRLQKDKILSEKYVELDILDFLEHCVLGHCNMIVSGETGSGKTELVKYLASKIADDEKIITIEDTLELHLDKIFPHRDIVAMKTNNIASYTDILEACMRQNPKWILLSEVRSAEAVLAIRNSISSGHYILSTIHADKASSIPNRMYSLLETNQDVDQFMSSICRYIQIGIYVRGFTDKDTHTFKREIAEVTEFYVTNDTNEAKHNVIYRKGADGKVIRNNPSSYLIDYLEVQGVFLPKELKNMDGSLVSSDEKISIQEPLSESEISDNQTVTFNSEGAHIETNNVVSDENIKNFAQEGQSGIIPEVPVEFEKTMEGVNESGQEVQPSVVPEMPVEVGQAMEGMNESGQEVQPSVVPEMPVEVEQATEGMNKSGQEVQPSVVPEMPVEDHPNIVFQMPLEMHSTLANVNNSVNEAQPNAVPTLTLQNINQTLPSDGNTSETTILDNR